MDGLEWLEIEHQTNPKTAESNTRCFFAGLTKTVSPVNKVGASFSTPYSSAKAAGGLKHNVAAVNRIAAKRPGDLVIEVVSSCFPFSKMLAKSGASFLVVVV